MELGKIGEECSGGVTRTSLSAEDIEGRKYVIQLMQDAGLYVRCDSVGNIIGTLPGSDQNATSVMTGSHIDTVSNGGKFDGSLGVLGAIEAVRSIKENHITLTHPIEVVSFTDEEGARFGSGFIGSRGMVGDLKSEDLKIVDKEGTSYEEALRKAGYEPGNLKQATREPEQIKAYIEMHIEQGRVLESEKLSVGIATDMQGAVWLSVSFKGRADHAGATPMSLRRDPSLAMAEVLPVIEQVAHSWDGVVTVGTMEFKPGGANIIPEEVLFSVDFRHVNKEVRQHMQHDIIKALEDTALNRKVELTVKVNEDTDPVACTPTVTEFIENSCKQLNVPVYKMTCGAGHDAALLSKITAIGMILIRSKDGVSHHPQEWSSKEDCALGTQILLQTLIQLSK